MAIFRRKRRDEAVVQEVVQDPVVEQHKRRTHTVVKKAQRSNDDLKALLLADGITLRIGIAAGGRHGR